MPVAFHSPRPILIGPTEVRIGLILPLRYRDKDPGPYIKENVIPKGISVSGAAKMLNVSRPALSNFLNGEGYEVLERGQNAVDDLNRNRPVQNLRP